MSFKSKNIITTTCPYDCGGRCLLEVHTKNNKVIRIRSKDSGRINMKACPRGLLQKEILYHPERIKTPLVRTGQRGGIDFKPVSWEVALDIISNKLQEVSRKYGTESIYFLPGTGSLGVLNNTAVIPKRFFGMLGKCTTTWGGPSREGAFQSSLATFGTEYTGSTRDNILYSKFIILWGWDPDVTRYGSNTTHYLKKAKNTGIKIISIDPRYNQSARLFSEKWIPIRPGTDVSMLLAMAQVMIKEKIYSKNFIRKYTYGFNHFRDYISGNVDNTEKTPKWAEKICGVPAEIIRNIAIEYASVKPAALMTGWAPGRTAYGEQFHRAASVLAAMTGNIGNRGGFVSGGSDKVNQCILENKIPVPDVKHNLIHNSELYDAILNDKPAECRLLYIVGTNFLNQYPNINKGKKAFNKINFIVNHEIFLTPTAKFADIILPVSHYLERDDVGLPWIGGPYVIFMNKAVEPSPKIKSDFEIFTEIAKKMGIVGFNDISEMTWLEKILKNKPELPKIESLKKEDIYILKTEYPYIAFYENIKDPIKNPFPTPSGKIEIFSNRFNDMKNPLIPPIPKYISSQKESDSVEIKNYSLNLITLHSKVRINSQLDNLNKMKKNYKNLICINPSDAHKKNVKDKDLVYVYNERGKIIAEAKVNKAIISGAVSLEQGRWYCPDKNGIDSAGSVNVLTEDTRSPAGAFTSNTCMVQIEKL